MDKELRNLDRSEKSLVAEIKKSAKGGNQVKREMSREDKGVGGEVVCHSVLACHHFFGAAGSSIPPLYLTYISPSGPPGCVAKH